MNSGFYQVLTDDNHEYIIGIILGGILRPLKSSLQLNLVRVKLRILGNIANEPVAVPTEDYLNKLFGQKYYYTKCLKKIKHDFSFHLQILHFLVAFSF